MRDSNLRTLFLKKSQASALSNRPPEQALVLTDSEKWNPVSCETEARGSFWYNCRGFGKPKLKESWPMLPNLADRTIRNCNQDTNSRDDCFWRK